MVYRAIHLELLKERCKDRLLNRRPDRGSLVPRDPLFGKTIAQSEIATNEWPEANSAVFIHRGTSARPSRLDARRRTAG